MNEDKFYKESNSYDLSPQARATIDILRPVLEAYREINESLKVAITNNKQLLDNQSWQYEQLSVLLKQCQDILVGNELPQGKIGGIKNDLQKIISLLEKRTPWYVIIAAIGTIVTMIGGLFTILYYIFKITQVINGVG